MNYNKDQTGRKQRALVSKYKKGTKKASVILFKTVLVSIIALGIIGLGAGFGMFKGILDNSPDISQIDVQPDGFSTTVYDQKKKEIIKLSNYDSNRIYVDIKKIPKDMQNAFVAIEDERFFDHNGIDIQGIIRAFFVGIKNGGFSEGASTITQQLIKNNVFKVFEEDTFMERLERKIQEQYLALKLEETMPKEQILEYYLNTINLGQSSLGVQAASHRYFDKDVSKLTLSECVVIAGITQNPTVYDPVVNPEKNNEKRIRILNKMLEQSMITKKEYDEALEDNIYERINKINIEQSTSSVYSYFLDALIVQVINDLQEQKGFNQTQAYNALYRGGLSIYVTQDKAIQKICDDTFANPSLFPTGSNVSLAYRLSIEKKDGTTANYSEYDLMRYFKKTQSNFNLIFSSKESAENAVAKYRKTVVKKNTKVLGETITTTIQPQASFTIIDQHTGHVKALVGGRGEKTGNLTLNRATGTTRQPGSTFKPLATFLPALDTTGMTLATVYDDSLYNYEGTKKNVKNYYSGFRGLSTIRTAIRDSMNIVTAKAMAAVTPQVGYDYLLNLGFTTLVEKEVTADGSVFSDIQQPLALGGITRGVTNLELTAAYAAIANQGVYTEPILYTKILDHDGNVLIDNEPETRQVMKDSTSWLLTNAMKDVVNIGTGKTAKLNNMTSAGKTGTTSNNIDFWFSGYTPYYTASIWYGYDINTEFSSGNNHQRIWKTIMDKITTTKQLKNKDFPSSPSITTATICTKSGKLAVAGMCDHDPRGSMVKTEYFAKGTAPTEQCDVHVKLAICKLSQYPVSKFCPSFTHMEQIYIIRPENSTGTTADSPYTIPSDFKDKTCPIHSDSYVPAEEDIFNGSEDTREEENSSTTEDVAEPEPNTNKPPSGTKPKKNKPTTEPAESVQIPDPLEE